MKNGWKLFGAFLITISCSTIDKKNDGEFTKQSDRRGVWIAAPEHNALMHTPENLQKGLDKLDSLGINTLFLCAWAGNKTAWESDVLLKNSNYNSITKTSMFDGVGYTGDPVNDLIEEAHKRDMQVLFWFEYGFMADWGEEPDLATHPLLSKHPEWAGWGNDGRMTHYNGNDYYLNSYHPGVQDFLLDLIKESLDKYPSIDGIQGDDRLPASPVNSGYDSITMSNYHTETGREVPINYTDSLWIRWRLDKLNQFAVNLYETIKSVDSTYIMAFSPNPYPWCMENLMQEWPAWAESGIVDLLSVQCYRTDFESYKNTVDEAWNYASRHLDKNQFLPGVILGISSRKMMSDSVLDSIQRYNKNMKFSGESYFYVKWLTESQEFDSLFFNNRIP